MPQLDVNGAVLYYETHGHISDPAILLIHAGVANLRMWDGLVPMLDRDHFVIRYDTRGFGNTSIPLKWELVRSRRLNNFLNVRKKHYKTLISLRSMRLSPLKSSVVSAL